MKKLFLFLLVILLLTGPMVPAPTAGSESAGSESIGALPLIRLAPGQALVGQFHQARHLAGFRHPIMSSGRFFLFSGRGLVYRTLTPIATTLVIDRQGLRQFVEGRPAMTLGSAQFRAAALVRDAMEAALTGDWSRLGGSLEMDRTVASDGSWQLIVRPPPEEENGRLPFTRLELSGRSHVQHVVVRRRGGDYDRLTFSDQRQRPLAAAEKEAGQHVR